MRIRCHPESHVVELDDGSQWQISPGDLDVTLSWKPETDLTLERIVDEIAAHALGSTSDRNRVRVISAGIAWPVQEVKKTFRDG